MGKILPFISKPELKQSSLSQFRTSVCALCFNVSSWTFMQSLKFSKVTNAVIENIKSVNSKSFHMAVNQCQGITAHRLNIIAPYNSPNTDGIHISSSDSINVTSSFIRTGDDCISIGQGATHVFISNITCGPGHGIRLKLCESFLLFPFLSFSYFTLNKNLTNEPFLLTFRVWDSIILFIMYIDCFIWFFQMKQCRKPWEVPTWEGCNWNYCEELYIN